MYPRSEDGRQQSGANKAMRNMPAQRNREEAVNTQLAILISRYGVTADGETIHVHGRHRPDVLFQLRGLRVAIEGKFPDHPNAADVVLNDARHRARNGLVHIAAAVVYAAPLRSTTTTKIIETLEALSLRYKIVAETHETDWSEGSPAELMNALRRAQETLTHDDIVQKTAEALSAQLETVSRLWNGQPGACDRLSSIIRMTAPKGEAADKAQDRRGTAARVAAFSRTRIYFKNNLHTPMSVSQR